MAKDPYDILSIAKIASDAEIKTAYRNLAKKHHPDLNPGSKDDSKFKEIGAAHALLSDKEKRAAFARSGIWSARADAPPQPCHRPPAAPYPGRVICTSSGSRAGL